jgi:hypothetical protein
MALSTGSASKVQMEKRDTVTVNNASACIMIVKVQHMSCIQRCLQVLGCRVAAALLSN